MSTGFQFYEGTMTDSASSPKITVRRGGVLVLTSATVAMLGDDVTHVQIGFNPETKAIALRSADEDSQGSYRLRAQKNSVSRLVDGKRVFKHHGITATKSRSFDAEDFGEGLVGFRMNDIEPDADGSVRAKPEAASNPAKPRQATAKK